MEKPLKTKIRNELKILGISHSSLFPDMDRICRDLNENLIEDLNSENIPS
jgi:hypothetical protein